MLFTAGYLWDRVPVREWVDLKGKSVAVNKRTPYETLSKAKGAERARRRRLADCLDVGGLTPATR